MSAASHLLTRGPSDSAQALNAIQLLDPSAIFRTCVNFPQRRKFDSEDENSQAVDETLYDPVYVILLFAQLLVDQAPSSALVWVQVFRTNVVSLLLRSLSSDDGSMREMALAQIAGLHRCLQVSQHNACIHHCPDPKPSLGHGHGRETSRLAHS